MNEATKLLTFLNQHNTPHHMFKLLKQSNKARHGEFTVNSKTIPTPFFMVPSTKAALRHTTMDEFKSLGGNATICNSMLLSLRPGAEFINKNGGIHKFMNFDGVTFTDSGGFQVIRQFCLKIDNNGIWFKSPYDGKKEYLDPQKCIQNHINIDSDVAMCLDHMPLAGATKSEALYSLNRTTEWAKLCKETHHQLKENTGSNQLLFGIAQGGIYPELRKRSIKEITDIGFDGYALGGLAIGEPKKQMFEMMELGGDLLPKNKLRYIMGLGHPLDIVKAVSLGFDCFDSIFPTQCARHNHLFTSEGVLKISNKEYKHDQSPIDKNCNCVTCKNYTRAYIYHITKVDEPIAYQLKTYHNIHFMYDLMKQIQVAIKEDRFEEWKEGFVKNFKK